MIKILIQTNLKERNLSSGPDFFMYSLIVKSKPKKNESISQPVIWPLCGRQIRGLPGEPQFRCRVPRDTELAPGDNNSPDVITSAAGELESSKGLLMVGRDQINNLSGLSHTREVCISTKEQISFP